MFNSANATLMLGVIPRAAAMLFRDLAGPPPLNRNGSSGLRTPTRYSTNMVQTLQSLSKNGGDKNWQLKATYVEVRLPIYVSLREADLLRRYTTNSCGIC